MFHAVYGLQITAVQRRVFHNGYFWFDDGFVQIIRRITLYFKFRVVEVLFAAFVFLQVELHEDFPLIQHILGIDNTHQPDRLWNQHSEFLWDLNLFIEYNIIEI